MKTRFKIKQEVEITHVRITVPVRYGEEDIPNDFPLRKGDTWEATVNIDTGVIKEWPVGRYGNMHMKVCDSGTYSLLGKSGETVGMVVQDYVPHGVVPGSYGDYIIIEIDPNGQILNWPKRPDVSAFFSSKDICD